jgi:hypothetical protein
MLAPVWSFYEQLAHYLLKKTHRRETITIKMSVKVLCPVNQRTVYFLKVGNCFAFFDLNTTRREV